MVDIGGSTGKIVYGRTAHAIVVQSDVGRKRLNGQTKTYKLNKNEKFLGVSLDSGGRAGELFFGTEAYEEDGEDFVGDANGDAISCFEFYTVPNHIELKEVSLDEATWAPRGKKLIGASVDGYIVFGDEIYDDNGFVLLDQISGDQHEMLTCYVVDDDIVLSEPHEDHD